VNFCAARGRPRPPQSIRNAGRLFPEITRPRAKTVKSRPFVATVTRGTEKARFRACRGGRWQGVAGRREGGQDRSQRSRLCRPLRAARRDASLCLHSDRARGPHARRASRFHRRKDRLYCPFPDARHGNACAKVWTVQVDANALRLRPVREVPRADLRTCSVVHHLSRRGGSDSQWHGLWPAGLCPVIEYGARPHCCVADRRWSRAR
jgi:hypothetical protein